MIKTNKNRFVPLLISLGVCVGILLGSFFANHFTSGRLNIINNSSNKVIDLFHLVDDQYVDSVNISDLVEKSMPQILKELDPHSVYISAADADASMQELKGSFSGIGVQFSIFDDTIRIVRVLPGGPSEGSGLIAGDRIVKVNGELYVGDTIHNDGVMKRLKGPGGSTCRIEVQRAGVKQLIPYSIVRGAVPVHTVSAVYMVTPQIGYIRINSFGDTTYGEFLAALSKLQAENFEKLIIDLRGNLGGYMEPAIQIANEFLPKNALIVYTEGRKSPRKEYRTDGRGVYQSMPLTILIDETSASASEILAGAIQDNDRGTIIGRRSFGKGLVQVPIEFPDGSMLRLTTARYYTPSGRCVQKPYTPGDEEKYEADLLLRAESGEYFSADSIRQSGTEYHTRLGRVVYGGGGIVPDIFVPRDTVGMTSYFRDAYMGAYIHRYAYHFVDSHRQALRKFTTLEEVLKFLRRYNLPKEFAAYAETKGLKRRNIMLHTSYRLFQTHLTSAILSDIFDEAETQRYANQTDPMVIRAVGQLSSGNKDFPKVSSRVEGAAWKALLPPFRSHAITAAVFSIPFSQALCPFPSVCQRSLFEGPCLVPAAKPSSRTLPLFALWPQPSLLRSKPCVRG